jgi:hypothetical protein
VTVDDLTSTYHLLAFTRAVDRVADQASCSRDDATELLIERANSERCSLGDLAHAVLERRIQFGA